METEGAEAPSAKLEEDASASLVASGEEQSTTEMPEEAEYEPAAPDVEVTSDAAAAPAPSADETKPAPEQLVEGESSSSTVAVTDVHHATAAPIASPVPSTSSAPPSREPSIASTLLGGGKPSQAALAAQAQLDGRLQGLQAKRARTQKTRQAALRARIDEDPADGQAWLDLIADVHSKGDLDRTRELYQEFLGHFPDAGRQWIAYADIELQHGHWDRVEEIFTKCLRDSTSVDLWRFYITYLRRRNPIDGNSPEKAKETRAIITSAFEFSLTHVGIDREAGVIWQDYLSFLREGDGRGQWEEQQKMDALRRTFQRAVVIPLNNVEEIWGDYNNWENTLNKMTARKFIGEKSAGYTAARLAMRVMRPMLDAVATNAPLPHRPDWSNPQDRKLLDDWKAYLAWEEGNPLALDDPAALQARVYYAHRKATVEMRFFPEVWFSAAAYARSTGNVEECTELFKNGMSANPTSLLVHFGFAELEESRRNFAESHAVYDALLARLNAELERINKDQEQEIAGAVEGAAARAGSANGAMEEEGAEDKPDHVALARQAVVSSFAPRIHSTKSAMASVWINQLRFARRSEGKKQARDIFGRARKSGVVWQVYEAAAMIEYHLNKEPKVASNVFELGLKQFDKDVDFVLRYLEYLINVNDDANARAVFERTIGGFAPNVALKLWERWSRYESEFGDLAAIQKLDERIAEAYPNVRPVSRFAERTGMYLGLDELPKRDMGIGISSRGRSMSVDRSRSRSPPPYRRKRSTSPIPPPRIALRERGASPDGRGPAKRGRFGRNRSVSPPPAMPRRTPLLAPGAAPLPRRPNSPPRNTPPPESDGLPESISFFLRILPSAASFGSSAGPVLDGNIVVEVIANAAGLQAARPSKGLPPAVPMGGDSPLRRPPAQRSLPAKPQGLSYGQARY